MKKADASLEIVVSCSNRKSRQPSNDLMMRHLTQHDLVARFSDWQSRITELKGDCAICAQDLYKGDHWRVAQSCLNVARIRGWTPRLWVASAGHGLISDQSVILPYSATFNLDSPDSVGKTTEELNQWWRLLNTLEANSENPRSLLKLTKLNKSKRYLIVLSNSYGSALLSDIEETARELGSASNLIVLSGGWRPQDSPIASRVASVPHTLQRVVGGTLASLNVRVLRKVLEALPPDNFSVDGVTAILKSMSVKVALQPARSAIRLSDSEVKKFVLKVLRKCRSTSFTSALRELRDGGRSCEHNRFKALFNEVKAGIHAT